MSNIRRLKFHSDDSIKVIVRVRPPDQRVAADVEHGLCLEVHDARTIVMHTKPEHRVFTFDHVAGMETTQVRLGYFDCFSNITGSCILVQ